MPHENPPSRLAAALSALEGVDPFGVYGRVAAVRGLLVEVAGPVSAMRLGGRLDIEIERAASCPAR
jgi:flagellum-specific ATP synthase